MSDTGAAAPVPLHGMGRGLGEIRVYVGVLDWVWFSTVTSGLVLEGAIGLCFVSCAMCFVLGCLGFGILSLLDLGLGH